MVLFGCGSGSAGQKGLLARGYNAIEEDFGKGTYYEEDVEEHFGGENDIDEGEEGAYKGLSNLLGFETTALALHGSINGGGPL